MTKVFSVGLNTASAPNPAVGLPCNTSADTTLRVTVGRQGNLIPAINNLLKMVVLFLLVVQN